MSIISHNRLNAKRLDLSGDFSTFQYVALTIPRKFNLISVYRPGSHAATNKFFDDFGNLLSALAGFQSYFIIVADINIHLEVKNDSLTCKFLNLLAAFELCLTFNESTHVGWHMLDCIIVPLNFNINEVLVHPPGAISDHSFIEALFPSSESCRSVTTNKVCRPWRSLDVTVFRDEVLASDIGTVSVPVSPVDPNALCERYWRTLTSILDSLIPCRSIPHRVSGHNAPWFDYECILARRKKKLSSGGLDSAVVC